MMTPEQKRRFEEAYISFARMWGLQTHESSYGTFGYQQPNGVLIRGWLTVMDCAMDYISQRELQKEIEAACLAAGVGSMFGYAKGHPREAAVHTYYCPRRSDAMALREELRANRDKSPPT